MSYKFIKKHTHTHDKRISNISNNKKMFFFFTYTSVGRSIINNKRIGNWRGSKTPLMYEHNFLHTYYFILFFSNLGRVTYN